VGTTWIPPINSSNHHNYFRFYTFRLRYAENKP
jgi:hypothetical protein